MRLVFRIKGGSHTFDVLISRAGPVKGELKPHSPLFKARHGLEQRKLKLFRLRPEIPGRRAKLFIGTAFCFWFAAIFGCYCSWKMTNFSRDESRKITRRILPFVQAMEDVRFVAIQERNHLILKAICDTTDPTIFDEVRKRYNQEDFFLSFLKETGYKFYYDGKYSRGRAVNSFFNRQHMADTGLFSNKDMPNQTM